MEKKIYVAPKMKVRKFESENLLAASPDQKTPISDDPATGGGQAKSNNFSSEEDNAPIGTNNNIWGD